MKSQLEMSISYHLLRLNEQYHELLERILDSESKSFVTKALFYGTAGFVATVFTYKLYRSSKSPALSDPTLPVSAKLVDKNRVARHASRLRFSLPKTDKPLGIPPGNQVNVSAIVDKQIVSKDFTPLNDEGDLGHMDLIVPTKIRSKHATGDMAVTQYLDKMSIGDQVDVSGPHARLTYQGAGWFVIKRDTDGNTSMKQVRRVAMIAGSTGISSVYPVLRTILSEDADFPKCSLVYLNKTEQDIVLREELKSLSLKNRARFMLWHVLEKPSLGWKYGVGTINEEVLKDWMPKPGPQVLILISGSGSMVSRTKALLGKLKYTEEMVFTF